MSILSFPTYLKNSPKWKCVKEITENVIRWPCTHILFIRFVIFNKPRIHLKTDIFAYTMQVALQLSWQRANACEITRYWLSWCVRCWRLRFTNRWQLHSKNWTLHCDIVPLYLYRAHQSAKTSARNCMYSALAVIVSLYSCMGKWILPSSDCILLRQWMT